MKIKLTKARSLVRKRHLLTIMRIFIFFLCTTVFSFTAESSYSQQKVIIEQDMEVTVDEVFQIIKNQTQYRFLYPENLFKYTPKIRLQKGEIRLSELLNETNLGSNITIELSKNNTIVLKEADLNQNEDPTDRLQEIEISGTVTDTDGNPLPGVNVIIDGTINGTETDFDGNYVLNVEKGNVLVFLFIGMETSKVTVGNELIINVTLLPTEEVLEEVVVVGYGTRKKVNLTGAVQQITAKELENRVVVDPVKALQGAIPGLNITYGGGRATTSPNINIRGFESLSGGEPLIIIDGVPSTLSQFTELNPSDIASVSTLMDAASAAIYGARAAFGVVLVTTKSAGSGKLQVSFDTNVSMKSALNLPEFVLDPVTYMESKVLGAGGWYDLSTPRIWGNSSWDLLQQMADSGTEVMVNPENTSRYLYAGRTNWFKEAIKSNSMTETYNLSLSGRNEKVSYYLSGGYSSVEGAFKYGNDQFDKYNLRTKLDFKVTDWLTFSNNTSYTADEYDEPNQGFNFYALFNYKSTEIPKNLDGSWTEFGAWSLGAASEGGRYTTSDSRLSTAFKAKASFWDDLLTVTGQASFMRRNYSIRGYSLPVEFKFGPDFPGVYNPSSEAQRRAGTTRQKVYDIYADVNKSFGEHNLHLLVGYNQEYMFYDSFYAKRKELISASVPTIDLATGDRDVGESITDWSTRSGFFRFNYDYNGKYLIELNGRYDGTSRFPKEDRFGFFPSISVGWNVTKENFFPEGVRKYVSTFKPRFSYGALGNQDVGAYAYLPTMSSGTTSSILSGEQKTTLYAPGLVSGSLTWETVKTVNFGLDFGFFKNRLTGSTNYYERSTLDMLTKSKLLPGVLGTSEPQDNAADLITKGWDLSIRWRDKFELAKSDFSYSFGAVLADSRTWITDFDNPNGNLDDYYNGYEIGTIWGFEVDGLFQTPEEIANHANQSSFWSYPDKTPPSPGDIKFNDLNGDGVIRGGQTINDLQDQRKIGNGRSRYTIGVSSDFNWKGFDLNMFWQGVLKRDWYPTSINFWGLNSNPSTNLQVYNYNNSWTPETPDAYMPRLKGYAASWWSGGEMLRTNTRYLQNAWYMRLKNLTIGYSLPSNFNDKVGLDKVRFSITGENLISFTGLKNPNIDPETLGNGYPMQRLIALGLNVKF